MASSLPWACALATKRLGLSQRSACAKLHKAVLTEANSHCKLSAEPQQRRIQHTKGAWLAYSVRGRSLAQSLHVKKSKWITQNCFTLIEKIYVYQADLPQSLVHMCCFEQNLKRNSEESCFEQELGDHA